jgi:hypothetical protein
MLQVLRLARLGLTTAMEYDKDADASFSGLLISRDE